MKTAFKAITTARYSLRIIWMLTVAGWHQEYLLSTSNKIKQITSWYFLCFRVQRIQWFVKHNNLH
ncbi:MAG: hypothetical protein EOP49_18990 [Sphingobacteriales bacterium]|nr:MAG: hypothetical protein EOP49_18990 [Sphingobacteriales bacterium]